MTTITIDRALLEQALDALTCSGDNDDPGHRCSHCDDYVDRNSVVRQALRAALAAQQPAPAWRDAPTCPVCKASEVDALTPRTVYACGSSDYDQRPGTFTQGVECLCPIPEDTK